MGGSNTLGQHECAVTDCHIQVSLSRLMCQYHWIKVPNRLRREVNELYTSWLKHHGQTGREQYLAARDQAIQAVEDLQSKA